MYLGERKVRCFHPRNLTFSSCRIPLYRDLSPPEILTGSVPFDPDDGQVDADGLLMELENKWKPIFEKLDDGKSGKTYPAVRLAILKWEIRLNLNGSHIIITHARTVFRLVQYWQADRHCLGNKNKIGDGYWGDMRGGTKTQCTRHNFLFRDILLSWER